MISNLWLSSGVYSFVAVSSSGCLCTVTLSQSKPINPDPCWVIWASLLSEQERMLIWCFQIYRSSGQSWPLVVGLRSELFILHHLGCSWQANLRFLILDVSINYVTVTEISEGKPTVVALSPRFSCLLPRTTSGQALTLGDAWTSVTHQVVYSQHQLLCSTGAFPVVASESPPFTVVL